MSSYNKIEKIKYTKNTSEVVNLKEYIVFENERKQEKHIVFKFANEVNQQLLGMEFEVKQYDVAGELVEKSVVIYDRFLSKANADFVPNAKLKVNYACKTISVRLIKAAFDRFLWNEGEYEDNTYTFEHYYCDEQLLSSAPAADAKGKRDGEPKEDGKEERKKEFELVNETNKNIARFPAVFFAFVFIIVCVFVGLSLYFFQKDTDEPAAESVASESLYANEVGIHDGLGEDGFVISEIKGAVIKIGGASAH